MKKYKIIINGFMSGEIYPYMLKHHSIEIDFSTKTPTVYFEHVYKGEDGSHEEVLKAKTELKNFFDNKEMEQQKIYSLKNDLDKIPTIYKESFYNDKSTARFKKIIYVINNKEYYFANNSEKSDDYIYYTEFLFAIYPVFQLKDLNVKVLKHLFSSNLFN